MAQFGSFFFPVTGSSFSFFSGVKLKFPIYTAFSTLLSSITFIFLKLDFIFSCYRNYKHNPKGKDGESILIPQRGYNDSEFLIGQTASISERATKYPRKDFDFYIFPEENNFIGYTKMIEPEEVIEEPVKEVLEKEVIEQKPKLKTPRPPYNYYPYYMYPNYIYNNYYRKNIKKRSR